MDAKLSGLLSKLAEASALLRNSRYDDLAESYNELARRLSIENRASRAFKDTLAAVDRSLAGMGSFSDVPLVPQQGPMTRQQARQRQSQLVQEIADAVAALQIQ